MSDDIRNRFFPMSLPSGVMGYWVIRSEATTEIKALNKQIFGIHQLHLFEIPPEREANAQRLQSTYSPSNPDCIVFYDEKSRNAVGWFYSYREDATTILIDTVGFLPEYRGRGLYTAFLPKYLEYVTVLGLERVTTSHHPNNRAIMIAELKVGFHIVGMELHESYGPNIKMAYFLHEDRRSAFEQAFTMAPDPTASFKR